MKITERSQSKLAMHHTPFGQFGLGAVLIAAGVAGALVVSGADRGLGIAVCLVLAAAGAFLIAVARKVTIVADKLAATVTVARRSLVGSRERVIGIPDVDKITYRESVSTTYRQRKGMSTTWQDSSVMTLKDGSSVVLGQESKSAGLLTPLLPTHDYESDRELAVFMQVEFVQNVDDNA